ncbi:GH25 family lysozyme [Terrilactibacillus laevilacticus]|uniref:GH25 family lysozyme n=1 Tax=Terrilactibacillus laevilacticus TaxID=1380157 RepID=UPI0011406F27|nr:GH25 family lysozyme [Terrilactibacillus laevilacticus]
MNKWFKYIFILAFSFGVVFLFIPSSLAEKPDADFIDVSHHNRQSGLPLAFYQMIKNSGTKSVVVKVSEGTYHVDPAASVNIANAKQAGLVVNAYHFAHYNSHLKAKLEADWFDKKLRLVGFNKTKDGYVVVDIEAMNLSQSPKKLTGYTNTFIKEMKRLGYPKVDIYTGSYFYNNRLDPESLIITKPWLASYPKNPIKNKPTAIFSHGKGAWQWTSDYYFLGLKNYGNFDASEDYAGKYTKQTQSSTKGVKQIKTVSLVNYMKSKNMNPSYNNRVKLAKSYGIINYSGTASQNIALLSKLKSGVKPAKVNISNSKLTTKTTTNLKTKQTFYKVKFGDTLSEIASKLRTTVSKLKSVNHIKNANIIRINQRLKIPRSNSTSLTTSKKYYKVNRGDYLGKIAIKYHTSVRKIKSLNSLKSDIIFPNQRLRIK